MFGEQCLNCGDTGQLTASQLNPERGWSLANLQPLCLNCDGRQKRRRYDFR